MALRIGELMVRRGLLSPEQVNDILERQRTGGGAFGDIAERLFGLDPADVESVWAEQYASITPRVDPREAAVDAGALESLSPRQAWQFRVLPLSHDGAELALCTTVDGLPRALRFAYRCLRQPCYFLIADPEALGEALATHYPMAGMEPQWAASPLPVPARFASAAQDA
jgi:hypothetical protein